MDGLMGEWMDKTHFTPDVYHVLPCIQYAPKLINVFFVP